MTTRSRPQKEFERSLEALRIGFMAEHPEFPPWELDIYLPEWHLCVEIDGPNHGPKRDARRDEDLRERYGIETLRLPTEQLATVEGRHNAIAQLIQFLEQHADSTADRKRRWRSNSSST